MDYYKVRLLRCLKYRVHWCEERSQIRKQTSLQIQVVKVWDEQILIQSKGGDFLLEGHILCKYDPLRSHAENVIYITKSLEFWHYETKGLVLVNKYAKDCDWYPKRLHAALSSKVLTPIDTFHLVVYKNLSPLSPGAPHPSGGNVRQLPGSAECNGWKKEHCPIIVGRVENISSSSTSQNCHLAFISLPHIFFTFLFVAKKCSEWLGAFLHKVGFTYKMENQETNNPIVALEIAQAHHFSF